MLGPKTQWPGAPLRRDSAPAQRTAGSKCYLIRTLVTPIKGRGQCNRRGPPVGSLHLQVDPSPYPVHSANRYPVPEPSTPYTYIYHYLRSSSYFAINLIFHDLLCSTYCFVCIIVLFLRSPPLIPYHLIFSNTKRRLL